MKFHMKSNRIPFAVFMLIALGLFVSASHANVSKSDRAFMMAAAQGGMMEVKLGQLAVQKGDAKAKDFGNLMITDHTAINDKMKTLADQKSVTLPDSLDAKHQGMIDKLAAMNGALFDKSYIDLMIKAHKMDAKAFKKESAKTKDADIKAFVDDALPIVEKHLKMVSDMK